MRKKLLWVGDAACPSGFARATHETLAQIHETFDVMVLGINYRGDPHPYPYPIYAAAPGGDAFGVGRLIWMMDMVHPDVVVLQNDPWNIPAYMRQLKKFPEHADTPVVGAIAVDGLNCQGSLLNDLAHCVFWTEFGREQARLGGHQGASKVIPLGVDLDTYCPGDRREARARLGFPTDWDGFVVGCVNRNQPRKRFDLLIRYFAMWIKEYAVKDAYLFLHVAPTGDTGYDVLQLASYYGIRDRLILREPPMFYGVSEQEMADTYRAMDVVATTTQGEGFGLSTWESMACGIPNIVPTWSSLGEIPADVVCQVACKTTAATHGNINVIGGVPDETIFMQQLHMLYFSKPTREARSQRGLEFVQQDRYRWSNISLAFRDVLTEVVGAS